jgi:hypothetical protein
MAAGAKLIIPLGLAISCLAHLALLTPAVYFGGRPFDMAPPDAITVDIVSPEEAGEAPKPEETADAPKPEAAPPNTAQAPAPSLDATALLTSTVPSPAAAPQPQLPPAPRALAAQGGTRQAAAQTQLANPARLSPTWLPQPVAPDAPEPPPQTHEAADMFAMPLALPGGRIGYEYQGTATEKPDVADDAVAAFRKHLKTCSTLPPEVTAGAKVTLRINLNPDGSLVRSPENPHAVGPVQGALHGGGGDLYYASVAAVRKCQPYKMLPPDKYEDWKTLDVTFTRENF